jgi:predicted RNA-binding protein associated with RNAse of E/G family
VKVTEVKRHLDGRVERFACRLVLRRPHLAVLRFDHARARRASGLTIPAGSRTFGFFWSRRPYLLYRIEGPRGDLIACRFDAVDAVRLGDDEVSYLDLLLDLWLLPDGTLRVEDEDDVTDFARRGLLTTAQRARIERARTRLLRRAPAVAREAGRLLA